MIEPFSARFEFVKAGTETGAGPLAEGSAHLRIDRTIHHGVHEATT